MMSVLNPQTQIIASDCVNFGVLLVIAKNLSFTHRNHEHFGIILSNTILFPFYKQNKQTKYSLQNAPTSIPLYPQSPSVFLLVMPILMGSKIAQHNTYCESAIYKRAM